ncbi:phosphotransferase [Krasilnikovia sp. MM14-A1259]|uniref:phosphotransferase n=1 Tax=Krasilnikovia sp. MM14-A1259 TaxID=3373539 RepID=UPI00382A5C78
MSTLDAVRAVTGDPAHRLVQDRPGRAVVRVVDRAGRPSIIKFDSEPARSLRERRLLEHLAGGPAGALVPAVLGHGRCPDGTSYLRLEDVRAGRAEDLSRSGGGPGSWHRVGARLRRLHAGLAGTPCGPAVRPWSAPAVVAGHLSRLVDRGDLHRGHADLITARLAAVTARRAATVHGDLKREHVFHRGQVVRFIDLADACPADPLWDLAVLTLDRPRRTAALLAGYGADDPAAHRDVEAYRLVRAVSDVACAWRAGRPATRLLRRLHVLTAQATRRRR